ncbi:SAK1 protein [Pochonia chlamydosporia 170]|uniref:SAK1 protein n=1 Tax=Pochonia chlamydosporia 170 TaxID=1380566 RepID=A0A179FDF3_METCM|nr:SAK1 protein [Pochonia chlamydosporia 170]OAQ63516.1 SAK1 protein [Pochonia chlamydosporia 170]
MDQDNPPARPAVKSRKRPQSRASTTSVHSAATQPTLDQSAFADSSAMYAGQWIPNDHGHGKDIGTGPQMSPEDMILQAATHMQTANHDFSMDGSMGAAMAHHHHIPYQQQQHAMARHPLPAEQYSAANASFTEGDSQMLDRDDNEDGDSMSGPIGTGKPAATRSSANNELEMRQLFTANRHRNLQDVAGELHGNERGPNSERTRQVFAMLWINSVCSKGKGSVPRGRVYANYASRCATERITVLNPASFGKLVRVLFPGLKTRRLGVRGESKYHYVNFSLIDDQPDLRESQPPPPKPLTEAKSLTQSFHNSTSQANTTSRAPLPSPQDASQSQKSSGPSKPSSRSHSLYNQPDLASIDNIRNTSTKTELELSFLSAEDAAVDQHDILALPAIELYLPQGTDPDAAKSLSALYRSHCTSLVECIRYCREKTFFHLYTSFQGTLTMPVQKLFGHAAIAPWIEGCDYVLYQRMMSIISGLTLQVVPKPVLDTLRNISERLVPHIRESFQGQPQHVLSAKEAPAALFSGLIDRALRVNLTAHAAANMLSNPANRDQMYVDWITMIRARKIAECVPTRGMDDVVDILVSEMRDLLDPVNVPWEVECLTIYGDVVARSGRQTDDGSGANSTGQNVLERWVNFLQTLPNKFTYASHTDIVWCVERVGTAVMRDLTLAQGKSFGSWWVTKTWVDEMVCFLAEQGGFMKQKPQAQQPTTTPANAEAAEKETSRQNSRYSSGSDDLNLSDVSQSQPGRAPFPPPPNSNQASLGVSGGDPHDDSGIGIRTPEEDFPMDKFSFTGTENVGMTGTELTAGAGL